MSLARLSARLASVNPDTDEVDIEIGRSSPPPSPPPDSDTAPLLPSDQPQQSWGAWAMSVAQRAATSTANTALYAVKHPVTSIVATATALPSAINAFVAPMHQHPSVISWDWWNKLSTGQQAHAAVNGVSSFTLNTLVNTVFLPQAATEFARTAPHTFDSPLQFAENFVTLLLATGAATATGMIAYNSFLFLPAAEVTAFIPAALSFMSALGSRYVGVTSVTTRIKNIFSDNVAAQKELLDILHHLDEETLERIKAEFQNIIDNVASNPRNKPDGDSPPVKPLTKGQFYELTKLLAAKLDQIVTEAKNLGKHPVKEKTTAERLQQFLGMFADMALGVLALAPAAFLTHMQKGFDGINLMDSGKLSNLSIFAKRAIGFEPGIAPAMLYAVCGLDMRTTLSRMASAIYQHPGSIPLAMLLLITNILSSSSMQNVGESIANKPDNIIGIEDKDSWYASLFIAMITLGGGVTNAKPSIELAFRNRPATLENVTYDEFVSYLINYNRNTISDSTTDSLRALGIFKDARPGATYTRPSSRNLVEQVEQTAPTFAGGV